MVLLLWCVCGGFLLHMLVANYLTILLKPSYEKAVDSPQDVLDRGLSVILPVYSQGLVGLLKTSPVSVTRELAERTVIAKEWGWGAKPDGSDTYDGLLKDAVVNGLSVVEATRLWSWEIEYGKWHRSHERKGGVFPFGCFIMNKKWTMEEQFNKHILRLQQVVTLSFNYFIKK